MKIHHIGIIVKDIEKNIIIYEKLGYIKISDIILDTNQNIKIVFIKNDASSQILELIESLDETSSIYHFKDGYHHICYEAYPKENFIHEFKKLKIGKIFTNPIKALAIDNRDVIFACLQNGTFIEFLL